MPPTYGMYSVCAAINDVAVLKVPLDTTPGPNQFQPRVDAVCELLSTQSPSPKLVFLTSPGNPTGTLIPPESIRAILDHPTWRGLLVVDEAYIDFDEASRSAVTLCVSLSLLAHSKLTCFLRVRLNEGYPNLVVMQTLSKGFGLAGIRYA